MADMALRDGRAVAVAGLGAVGLRVARALDAGIPGLRLTAVSAHDLDRARTRIAGFASAPKLAGLADLAGQADIVVECLPPACFRDIAEPVIARGGVLVAASVGALLANDDLVEAAWLSGARILAPSGAVAGLDALRAGSEAGLTSVRLVSRKPPKAFGAAVETSSGLRQTLDIDEATCLFTGTAREAVERFPRNINVAATVSLAGLGPDRTTVELWADPAVRANQHELFIVSSAGEVTVRALNLPDPDNPASSAVTGHSIVAALRRLVSPVVIGS